MTKPLHGMYQQETEEMADFKKSNQRLEKAGLKDIKETKVEKADDIKARLVLEKLEEDEAKSKAQQEMTACVKNQEKYQEEFNQSMSTVQDEIKKIAKQNQDLLEKLKKYQAELETKRAESSKLKQKFKISAQIPDTEVNFIAENKETREEGDEDSQPIRGVFTISQRAAMHLQGGQALITFEEEKGTHHLRKTDYDSTVLQFSFIYIVHLDVSRKELKVSNIPQSMPEERMKDRLEISFSRPSRGGGEVEKVEYDENTGTGHITFLHPGVAENLFLRRRYQVELDSEVNMQVGPIYNYQLRKFQTFCGCSKRTILLDDIQDMVDEEDLQDHLEIHFQKPSNSGGEIESIKYIAKGKSLEAFFCEDTEEMESAAP
uniref:NID domain-containing protein n=1 Tax=Amphilophus citrinellus TaxID=61819 RepID=A0A3Q0R315_AMPCI